MWNPRPNYTVLGADKIITTGGNGRTRAFPRNGSLRELRTTSAQRLAYFKYVMPVSVEIMKKSVYFFVPCEDPITLFYAKKQITKTN